VPTAPPALDAQGDQAERRHLSILFCDLVASTEIAAKLDPEDLRDLLTSYHGAATEAVERFGGHVALILGDGLLVYFGYPRAHDDDAQRAVLAGLAILDAISALNRRSASGQRPKLAARVGIHTGSVVVGESSGKGADVHGDVPIVASRVQNAASPDTVFITAATHQLVSGLFVVEDQGAALLKGIAKPVQLYRIIQPSGVRGRLAAAAARGLTPFIGREHELRLLLNCWDRARQGEGQVILVVGEPGIGKSRFLQRFREELAGTPHIWSEGAAAALHQNTPFYTVIDMLQQRFRWRGEAGADERIASLEASLGLVGASLTEAVPLIAPLVNLTVPAKYPPLQIPPEQQRRRLLATIAAWTLGIARLQPLVIAIEDLHWADPSSLEVMQLLAEQAAMAPLLLICTARPEFRAPWPMRTHHTHLMLNRLSARDVREIVAGMAAQAALAPAAIEALVERSRGVPLFAEELTRAVLERGDTEPSVREIPVTLHDLLAARLDRLGAAREVAQVGSVIGPEFSWGLLRAIVRIESERLEAYLRELADAEVLFEQGTPPDASYAFKHALIQDAAYQSLLRSTRHHYHRQIAQALQERFPEIAEAQPELVAHHYTEAALRSQAIPWWQAAGQKAVQRSANAEAVSHFTKGLELLNTTPEGAERIQQELGLQLALGTPLIASKGFASPEVGRLYARARDLCQQAGEVHQLFSVQKGLWLFHTSRAEHDTAHDWAEKCHRVAQAAQDPDLIMETHHALGVTFTNLGQFSAALEHLDEAIALSDPHRHTRSRARRTIAVACRSTAAWNLWFLGYPEQALKRSEEALGLATELSHPFTLTVGLLYDAWVHQLVRDRHTIRERAEAALAHVIEHDFVFWIPIGMMLQAWAHAENGQVEQGVGEMRQGLAAYRATGSDVMRPFFLAQLAELHGKLGQATEGIGVLAEAQEAADNSGERWWQPELYRLKGELTLQRSGDRTARAEGQSEIETYFRQSLEMASRLSAKSLELRAALSLSRLWQKQGRRAEARRVLGEVYGRFTEGFDTADLLEARTLLAEL
jgi:class 3 adenylate cyclase/predicted ATPase